MATSSFANRRRSQDMPAAPLELQIAEIWRRLLKLDEIGLDDDFFEVGGDSLQATEMLLELEKITRHGITPSEMPAQLTIRWLAERLLSADVATNEEVMTQVREGPGTPLFICHGDFTSGGFYAFGLTELLKHDGPVYLLHSILDEARGIVTVEEMVSRYMPYIEAAVARGPVWLAGYSHGGLSAFEIAGQLERMDRIVEKIILIDTFSLNARPLLRVIAWVVALAGSVVPGVWGRRIRRSGMSSVWMLTCALLNGDPTVLKRVARTVRTGTMRVWRESKWTMYFRALANYVPPKTQAEVLCLLCDDYAGKKEYHPGPWKRLANKVTCERIPGAHTTCITDHAGELAVHMNRLLVS
jgi:acyl carrier protein